MEKVENLIPENATVKLKAKDVTENNEKTFPLAVANKLLSLSGTQWELSDEGYTWNGKDLAVKQPADDEKNATPKNLK